MKKTVNNPFYYLIGSALPFSPSTYLPTPSGFLYSASLLYLSKEFDRDGQLHTAKKSLGKSKTNPCAEIPISRICGDNIHV